MIRPVRTDDAARICAIYNYYVRETCVSFEEEPVSVAEMEQRIRTVVAAYPWLVYERDGLVRGFTFAGPWKARSAYRYTAESTVYVDQDARGQGIGGALYANLILGLQERDLHVLIGVIALPNEASVALHHRAGFRQVARFSEVGFKFGRWLDVGYWELPLRVSGNPADRRHP